MEQFVEKSKSLAEITTDIYAKILMPFDSLLDVCLETEGIERGEDDKPFIWALKKNIVINFNLVIICHYSFLMVTKQLKRF